MHAEIIVEGPASAQAIALGVPGTMLELELEPDLDIEPRAGARRGIRTEQRTARWW